MFNHHSLIPWGSFRGRQEEKWGLFRGRDHLGVDLGIISGLEIMSGSGSIRGLYSTTQVFLYWYCTCMWKDIMVNIKFFYQFTTMEISEPHARQM